jgi:hypothetical protein
MINNLFEEQQLKHEQFSRKRKQQEYNEYKKNEQIENKWDLQLLLLAISDNNNCKLTPLWKPQPEFNLLSDNQQKIELNLLERNFNSLLLHQQLLLRLPLQLLYNIIYMQIWNTRDRLILYNDTKISNNDFEYLDLIKSLNKQLLSAYFKEYYIMPNGDEIPQDYNFENHINNI